VRLTPQFLRALHLELFTKPSSAEAPIGHRETTAFFGEPPILLIEQGIVLPWGKSSIRRTQ
jgi:hypothetical protein